MAGIKISYFNKPKRTRIGRHIPRNTPCGYCFEKWATCWDHIIPYSLGGPTNTENLMPACAACNGLLHDKVFNTVQEKREYVRLYQRSHRHKDFLPLTALALTETAFPESAALTTVSSGMTTFFFTDVRSY